MFVTQDSTAVESDEGKERQELRAQKPVRKRRELGRNVEYLLAGAFEHYRAIVLSTTYQSNTRMTGQN